MIITDRGHVGIAMSNHIKRKLLLPLGCCPPIRHNVVSSDVRNTWTHHQHCHVLEWDWVVLINTACTCSKKRTAYRLLQNHHLSHRIVAWCHIPMNRALVRFVLNNNCDCKVNSLDIFKYFPIFDCTPWCQEIITQPRLSPLLAEPFEFEFQKRLKRYLINHLLSTILGGQCFVFFSVNWQSNHTRAIWTILPQRWDANQTCSLSTKINFKDTIGSD